MIRRTVVVAALSVAACAGPADPGPADPGAAVTVRVIDVGPGLCTITTAPSASGPQHMVYDAGHWFGGLCLDAVDRIVGTAGVVSSVAKAGFVSSLYRRAKTRA